MDEVVFKQLEFVRSLTMKAIEGLSEQELDIIPKGFNNHIRWNLGHIYFVQEKLAFQISGGVVQMPDHFPKLFGGGTKPADWQEESPTLEQLFGMLDKQPSRIREAFQTRLDEPILKPFTTGSGITMNTIGECLNFTLYHEGLHYQAITTLKRFIR